MGKADLKQRLELVHLGLKQPGTWAGVSPGRSQRQGLCTMFGKRGAQPPWHRRGEASSSRLKHAGRKDTELRLARVTGMLYPVLSRR